MASALPHHRRRASGDGLLTELAPSLDANQQQKMKALVPPAVWDCGSTLYDSFELFALSQQLNRAIAEEESSARIVRDGHSRSVSMPHFATSASLQVVKEDDHEAIKDVDFSLNSQFETLHRISKARNRFGVPKAVKRLFSRAFYHRKGRSRDCQKSKTGDEIQSKASRSPSARMLCFTQPLIKLR